MANVIELPTYIYIYIYQSQSGWIENLLLYCGYFMCFEVDIVEKCKCHDVASGPPSPSS